MSNRAVVDPFKLVTATTRVSGILPISGLNERLQADIIFEYQHPSGFEQAQRTAVDSAISKALANDTKADTGLIRTQVVQLLDQYQKLDEYSRINPGSLTSSILALNYTRDFRNDIFYPSSGYTLIFLAEAPIPVLNKLSNFYRIQGTYTSYSSLSPQTVGALKARAGNIIWSDRDNSIVPFDRHYFAGGASSVRSFPSRQLRDKNSGGTSSEVGTLSDYIGLATVIEFSAELRYTFPYYQGIGEFLADKISRMGITFFADFGNGFNRLTRESYGKASIGDVLNPANWALAVGAGFRFALPIGPARLDFGVNAYDPSKDDSRKFITNRSFFDSMAMHISIGHAF